MTRWSRAEIETLISLYEGNSFLYDTKHADYHNRPKRDGVLQYIADRINEIRGNKLTLVDIKSKIKTLRTQYGAEKQHLLDRLRNSAVMQADNKQEVHDMLEPRLWCYENLKFLDEYTKDRTTETKTKRITIRSSKPPTSKEAEKTPVTEKEDVFGNFVAMELKQITDPRLQHETKWRIQLALKDGIEKQMEYSSESVIEKQIDYNSESLITEVIM